MTTQFTTGFKVGMAALAGGALFAGALALASNLEIKVDYEMEYGSCRKKPETCQWIKSKEVLYFGDTPLFPVKDLSNLVNTPSYEPIHDNVPAPKLQRYCPEFTTKCFTIEENQ